MINDIIKAGRYVAILNKANFDGYYTKVFDYPGMEICKGSAAWFYLNRIDLEGCVDKIYPIETFRGIAIQILLHGSGKLAHKCARCEKVQLFDRWLELDNATEEVIRDRITHGICPTCSTKHLEAMQVQA